MACAGAGSAGGAAGVAAGVAVVAGRKAADAADSIVTAAYPVAVLEKIDPAADAWVARLKEIVRWFKEKL